jgi:transposase-like protein
MTIVTIGKVNVQVDMKAEGEAYWDQLFTGLMRSIQEILGRSVEAILEEEIDQQLKRKRHYRRRIGDEESSNRMKCGRCGSTKKSDFRRNGHYPRGLETTRGHIEFGMPQVECFCGGGVRIEYKVLKRRQRIWKDLEAEFRSAYGYRQSLRAIKGRYDVILGGSLGLRTINRRVQAVAECVPIWQQTEMLNPPPVVRLDGIWITLMKATETRKVDALGRNRVVKVGKRVPILVAQGVWPSTGQQEVIGWVIGAGEDADSWSDLIFQLRQRGVRVEEIQLLIADGSSGLEALRQKQFPQVPFQRCIFHKLKNLWQALQEPQGLEPDLARTYKRDFLREAAQIWQARSEREACQSQKAFCLKWHETQPKATAILDDHFELTISFYLAHANAAQRGEDWPLELLRTTSHLERLNRQIRRRLDEAVLFQSVDGLEACLYLNQVFCQAFGSSLSPGTWSNSIEHQIAEAKCFLT